MKNNLNLERARKSEQLKSFKIPVFVPIWGFWGPIWVFTDPYGISNLRFNDEIFVKSLEFVKISVFVEIFQFFLVSLNFGRFLIFFLVG